METKLLKINLGCGMRKLEGYLNIDIREECNPDVIMDVEKGLYMHDDTVDEIRAFDFMEHIRQSKVVYVLSEIHRVLKLGGLFHFFIPSTEGPGAFMDPSHRSYWNVCSFLYFCHPEWHALYPTWPFFEVVEQIKQVQTIPEINLIHIVGKITPVKGEQSDYA